MWEETHPDVSYASSLREDPLQNCHVLLCPEILINGYANFPHLLDCFLWLASSVKLVAEIAETEASQLLFSFRRSPCWKHRWKIPWLKRTPCVNTGILWNSPKLSFPYLYIVLFCSSTKMSLTQIALSSSVKIQMHCKFYRNYPAHPL